MTERLTDYFYMLKGKEPAPSFLLEQGTALRCLCVNEAMARLAGAEGPEAVEQAFPGLMAGLGQALAALTEGQTIQLAARDAQGRTRGLFCAAMGGAVCVTCGEPREIELLEGTVTQLESMYKLVADHTDVTLWQYNMETDTLYNTEASRSQHGGNAVLPNFLKDKLYSATIRADSTAAFLALFEGLRAGRDVVKADVWIRDPGEKTWWCERITYVAVKDEQGRTVRAIGLGRNITGEVRAQADKEKLELALQSSAVTVWEYDVVNHCSIQTPQTMARMNLPRVVENVPEAIVSSGIVEPGSVKAYRELYAAVLRGEKESRQDVCMVDKDGNRLWFRLGMRALLDAQGHPVRAVGWGKDITDYKRMEQHFTREMASLASGRERRLLASYRVELDTGRVELYTGRDEMILAEVTHGYESMMEQLAQLCVTEGMREDYRARMSTKALLSSFNRGQNVVIVAYRRRMKDGTPRYVRTVAQMLRSPEEQRIVGYMYVYDEDVEELSRHALEAVAERNCGDVCIIPVRDGELRCVSHSGASFLAGTKGMSYGAAMAAWLKKTEDRFVDEGERATALESAETAEICKRLEKHGVWSFTTRLRDGQSGEISTFMTSLTWLDEQHAHILLCRTDLTREVREETRQRENLRLALAQAEQASRAKSDFLSRMSHEIRTPMNAIIGMNALAAQCLDDPAQMADCISKVGISARFLLSLINDILDMSRIESGKVTVRADEFPFEELINSINAIVYEQAAEKGVDYDCVLTSFTEPCYVGDAMKLQQVMLNLLGNAVKFTPAGGKVQFIIHQGRQEAGKTRMIFTVNDTGIGISEAFQKKMFDPFEQGTPGTTSPYGGTGLGLAISKNLVQLMNGRISVNSIEGVGSEFTVEVPLGISGKQKPLHSGSDLCLEKLHALVVDDDVVICEHTEALLTDMGIKAEWVDSGEKAVTRVKDRWLSRRAYDVILLDWKMPGMDGIETAREIRKVVGPDVTIIVMTAYDWASIEQEARAAGVNLLISKPLFKSSLISAFQKIYAGKEAEKQEQAPRSYDFTGRRVLLVEDHILNVEVARRLLESKHCQVEVAENGLVAIEAFTTAQTGHFDAILMDIRMPVMDGLTAARSIRQLKKDGAKTIPIIAMSANAFDEDMEKSKAAGMDAHLPKPIEPAKLYATLQEFFSSKAQQSAGAPE